MPHAQYRLAIINHLNAIFVDLLLLYFVWDFYLTCTTCLLFVYYDFRFCFFIGFVFACMHFTVCLCFLCVVFVVFWLFYLFWLICFYLPGVRRHGGRRVRRYEELGGEEGGEILIRIYHMEKIMLNKKRKIKIKKNIYESKSFNQQMGNCQNLGKKYYVTMQKWALWLR